MARDFDPKHNELECKVGEQQQPTESPAPWGYAQAIRVVVDDNFLLGAITAFRETPNALARWLLLLLFLTCAVFVQYADQAMGPICVRKYFEQCPPWKGVARHGIPESTYITMAPPAVDVPEGVKQGYWRRLDRAGRLLQHDVGVASDKTHVAEMRDRFLGGISYLLGGGWTFDCAKPMCDLFYPQMIDYVSLVRLTNMFTGSSTSHNIPATSDHGIVGYCKCSGPIYDNVERATVSNEARSIAVTVIVQTVLPKVFRAVFALTSGSYTGRCKCFMICLNRFITGLLLVIVVAMLAFIFLLKFDPQGWRSAAVISAVNLATLTPILSFVQLACCIKLGWPLRAVGFKPPAKELSERPVYVCFGCRGTSSGKTGFGSVVEQTNRDQNGPAPA